MMDLIFHPRTVVESLGIESAADMAEIHGEAFARGWSDSEFEALLGAEGVLALGLRRHSVLWPPRLVGFILLRETAGEAEVLSIALRSASRGRGLGRRLLDETMRHLYRERVEACFLEVDQDNEAAVRLYTSEGFEVVGERKGYYNRTDGRPATALVMRLTLHYAR